MNYLGILIFSACTVVGVLVLAGIFMTIEKMLGRSDP